jgi:hypothetical protein
LVVDVVFLCFCYFLDLLIDGGFLPLLPLEDG